jgi:hypothetical protein
VFARIGKGASMEAILAALFHRASATIYLGYSLWSIAAVFYGIPTLIEARGTDWQVLFSIAVALFSVPACFGATFWPSFARLEAFAGTGFVGLILLYIFYIVVSVVGGIGPSTWASVPLIGTILIIPTCRSFIVIMFLVLQAKEREARYQSYLDRLSTGSEGDE